MVKEMTGETMPLTDTGRTFFQLIPERCVQLLLQYLASASALVFEGAQAQFCGMASPSALEVYASSLGVTILITMRQRSQVSQGCRGVHLVHMHI